MSKGGAGDKSVYRGLGSIDFIAACRSALALHRHPEPERPDVRVLVHVKSNFSRLAPPLEFEIGEGGRVEWLGESDLTEADLRAAELPRRPGSGARGRPAEARAAATEWLLEALADGPVETQRLLAQAEDAGHSERTLRRAAGELRVETRRPRPGKGGAPTVPGTWELPQAEGEPAEAATEPDPPEKPPSGAETVPPSRAREGSLFGTPERERGLFRACQ